MLTSELQEMTVIELRKLARAHKVKLSAGISKDGIVEKLGEALRDVPAQEAFAAVSAEKKTEEPTEPSAPKETEDAFSSISLAADVTSLGPRSAPVPNPVPQQPTYRPAWQARIPQHTAMRDAPAWQTQQRPSGPSRFGPQSYVPQQPTMGDTRRSPEPSRQSEPRLDGYRLGYRAAPQRQDYGYRPQRQDTRYTPRPSYPQATPQQTTGTDAYYNDQLYKPMRDPAFTDTTPPQNPDLLQLADMAPAQGVLEIMPDGYGFLRAETLLPSRKDVYVSVAQIRRYDLRTGDNVKGQSRLQRESDKFAALLVVEEVNGQQPQPVGSRPCFEELTPIYPTRRIALENGNDSKELPIRLVDLIAPIGFGQRAMIVAPPEAGKTVILREICKAVTTNDPDATVMMLLIDERPEEVTLIRDEVKAEVFATTFEESPENQTRVAETMLERAQRLVEQKQNVVILLDSLTKLTRAYQASSLQGGRTYTNTVSPAALVKPKKFFGAARNTRDGGSLTVIATIAVDTGSRVDDIIFEEFKGTANMELWLTSPSESDPIFPAINLQKSSTRKDDTLLSPEEREGLKAIRQVLGSTTNQEALVQLSDMMNQTNRHADLLARLIDWLALWEKSGFLQR